MKLTIILFEIFALAVVSGLHLSTIAYDDDTKRK